MPLISSIRLSVKKHALNLAGYIVSSVKFQNSQPSPLQNATAPFHEVGIRLAFNSNLVRRAVSRSSDNTCLNFADPLQHAREALR